MTVDSFRKDLVGDGQKKQPKTIRRIMMLGVMSI